MSSTPSLMDSLFQRSLSDTVKALRLCPPGTEQSLVSKLLSEIQRELKSTDPDVKSIALNKLTYLHSLYHAPMSYASFHAVELSSSPSRAHKRVALLAASLSFDPNTTDVILLLTHQLRKDMTSPNVHDVGLALSTLASICNHDLARDLTPELFTLLGSSKSFVKKKVIAVLLRVFEMYPDAVRVCFKRVVENLESVDTGVLSAVMGLFCELTAKEPKSYLPLAPEFYKILVDCKNNWVLIKVLKIFARLAPLEPRLGKKVVEPICEHLGRTDAKSLAFECIRTILTSLSQYESAVRIAIAKAKEFLLEDDPNLKFLGLQALVIVVDRNMMWAVLENKELVIKALSDVDANIRVEALRLVMAMVSEDNVVEICRILIGHALKSDPEFCNEILGFVLSTCGRNYYELIYDFDWYVSFLGEMARIPHCEKGKEIEMQLVDIGMRVKDARPQLVHVARDLVIDPALLGNPFIHGVLSAAAWVSGEYVGFSRNLFELMEALLQPRTSLLAPLVRAVYIHSAFKVMTFCLDIYFNANGYKASYPSASADLDEPLSDTDVDNQNTLDGNGHPSSAFLTQESMLGLINLVETNLGPLAGSSEVEVQERACNVLGLIKLVKPKVLGHAEDPNESDRIKLEAEPSETVKLIFNAFSEELGPVSLNAQNKVPIPDGLELKDDLSDLESMCSHVKLSLPASFSLVKHQPTNAATKLPESEDREDSEQATESSSLLAEHRKRHGLYYLPSENKGTVSDEYPIAHDPIDKTINEAEDLLKLTEQSLVNKRKPSKAKPRPVVVKLDDGEASNMPAKSVQEVKTDLVSGAVQELLLVDEASTSSARKRPSNRLSKKVELDESNAVNRTETSEVGFVDSERGKQRTHSKERKHRSSGKNKEEKDQQTRHKSDHRRGKHKHRHRADESLPAQSPVIQDFLL